MNYKMENKCIYCGEACCNTHCRKCYGKMSIGENNNSSKQEVKNKISIKAIERWKNPDYIKFQSERVSGNKNPMFGKTQSLEHKEKRLSKIRGRIISQDTRNKISISNSTPENIEKFREIALKLRQQNKWKPSKCETKLFNILKNIFPDLVSSYRIHPYIVDMCLPEKKLVIEFDGIYWHNRPGAKEKDRLRQEYIESLGWFVIRFDDNDLRYITGKENLW